MSIKNVFAVTISFNERESTTVHIETENGNEPTKSEIESLVTPYVRKVYHESGGFEVEDITNVQSSIDDLLTYSNRS